MLAIALSVCFVIENFIFILLIYLVKLKLKCPLSNYVFNSIHLLLQNSK